MYDKVFLNYLLEVDHKYISELPGSQCKEGITLHFMIFYAYKTQIASKLFLMFRSVYLISA